MSAIYGAFHARGLFNPHGAMFLIPAFFFFFVKYHQTFDKKYLIFHILIAGLIIQFQMAIGIPLFALSLAYSLFSLFKIKKRRFQLLYYFLIFIPLVNFIVFDLRHQFLLSEKVLGFLTPQSDGEIYNYFSLVENRLRLMFTGVEILRRDFLNANFILFATTIFFILIQIKSNKYKLIYYHFLYFYVGFFALSFLNKGQILYFYFFPIFPLVFLIFSSFITSKYKRIFFAIFLVVTLANLNSLYLDTKDAKSFIGRDLYSWKFFK